MRRHFGHAVIRTRTQPRSTEIIAPHLLDLSSDDTSGVCVVRASRGDPVNPRPTQEGSSRQSRTPSSRRDARWLSLSSNGLLGGGKSSSGLRTDLCGAIVIGGFVQMVFIPSVVSLVKNVLPWGNQHNHPLAIPHLRFLIFQDELEVQWLALESLPNVRVWDKCFQEVWILRMWCFTATP